MTQQDYKEVAAAGIREQIAAIDKAITDSVHELLDQRTGLTSALRVMGFDPPPLAVDALVPQEPPANPPEADPPAPAASVADTGEPKLTQRAAADARRERVIELLVEHSLVGSEIAKRLEVSPKIVEDDIRRLLQDKRIQPTIRRRAEGQTSGRLAQEYGVTPSEPLITATIEQVRDCVIHQYKDGSFNDTDIYNALHATMESINDAFVWMQERGIIAPIPDTDGRYRYNKPTSAGGPPRRKQESVEREVGRQAQRIPVSRGRPVSGLSGRSNNGANTSSAAINALIREAERLHGATTCRGGGHLTVDYPNGCRVRVATTPGPEAIGLIRRDLENAAKGNGHLIQQGGTRGISTHSHSTSRSA